MQHTNWANIEIKRSWEVLSTMIDEQMIYFSEQKQHEVEAALTTVNNYIKKIK